MQNKLRVRRAELSLTQLEVAQRAGLHVTKLSHIETEKLDPTEEERAALARVLDTDEATLFPALAEQQQAGAR